MTGVTIRDNIRKSNLWKCHTRTPNVAKIPTIDAILIKSENDTNEDHTADA